MLIWGAPGPAPAARRFGASGGRAARVWPPPPAPAARAARPPARRRAPPAARARRSPRSMAVPGTMLARVHTYGARASGTGQPQAEEMQDRTDVPTLAQRMPEDALAMAHAAKQRACKCSRTGAAVMCGDDCVSSCLGAGGAHDDAGVAAAAAAAVRGGGRRLHLPAHRLHVQARLPGGPPQRRAQPYPINRRRAWPSLHKPAAPCPGQMRPNTKRSYCSGQDSPRASGSACRSARLPLGRAAAPCRPLQARCRTSSPARAAAAPAARARRPRARRPGRPPRPGPGTSPPPARTAPGSPCTCRRPPAPA